MSDYNRLTAQYNSAAKREFRLRKKVQDDERKLAETRQQWQDAESERNALQAQVKAAEEERWGGKA